MNVCYLRPEQGLVKTVHSILSDLLLLSTVFALNSSLRFRFCRLCSGFAEARHSGGCKDEYRDGSHLSDRCPSALFEDPFPCASEFTFRLTQSLWQDEVGSLTGASIVLTHCMEKSLVQSWPRQAYCYSLPMKCPYREPYPV